MLAWFSAEYAVEKNEENIKRSQYTSKCKLVLASICTCQQFYRWTRWTSRVQNTAYGQNLSKKTGGTVNEYPTVFTAGEGEGGEEEEWHPTSIHHYPWFSNSYC